MRTFRDQCDGNFNILSSRHELFSLPPVFVHSFIRTAKPHRRPQGAPEGRAPEKISQSQAVLFTATF